MWVASLLPFSLSHVLSSAHLILFPSTIAILTITIAIAISCFLFILFNHLTPAPFSPLPTLPFHVSSSKAAIGAESEAQEQAAPTEDDDEEEEEEEAEDDEDEEEDEEDEDEEEDEEEMVCLSCKEGHGSRSAGICKECYQDAAAAEAELRREIHELKARLSFLNAWAPQAISSADVFLQSSDGPTVAAHKAVLVSRSSVFKSMLDNETDESRRVIKVTDFNHAVLSVFVHYLYTAELYPESLEECAYDMLALAERYDVRHLKSVCERFMASKVNIHNALFNFEYANRHGAKILKEAALYILVENIQELSRTDEYKDLVMKDARLIVEIFEAFITKQFTGNNRRV